MPRRAVTVLVIDAIPLLIAAVLIAVGPLWAGIALIVANAVVVFVYVFRHVLAAARRNAELSASGVPGKTEQQATGARIFEE